MSNKFWSKSTGSCYVSAIHGKAMPSDVVEISDDLFKALNSRAPNQDVEPDENGMPVLVRNDYLSIDDLAAAKVIAIDEACAASIIAGFTSNALGATYRYSSDPIDQMNIAGNVQRADITGLDVMHNCYSENGVHERKVHTRDQMVQVGTDLASHIDGHLDRVHLLKQQVDSALAAKDEDALKAISW